MTLQKKGTVKKTEERTVPKSRGGSLAVGTYLQRDLYSLSNIKIRNV